MCHDALTKSFELVLHFGLSQDVLALATPDILDAPAMALASPNCLILAVRDKTA